MVPLKDIRDLLVGPAHPSETTATVQSVANTPTIAGIYEDPEEAWTARMPGDGADPHPLAETGRNPFPGVGVQAIVRALRAGTIKDEGLRKRAAAYVQGWKIDGQLLYEERNHKVYDGPVTDRSGLRRSGWLNATMRESSCTLTGYT